MSFFVKKKKTDFGNGILISFFTAQKKNEVTLEFRFPTHLRIGSH